MFSWQSCREEGGDGEDDGRTRYNAAVADLLERQHELKCKYKAGCDQGCKGYGRCKPWLPEGGSAKTEAVRPFSLLDQSCCYSWRERGLPCGVLEEVP